MTAPRKRRSPEHDSQTTFFRWCRLRFPNYSHNIFAVPNGGLRDVRVAKRLKDEGATAGTWDIMVCVLRNPFVGMCIEMKAGRNKLTTEQIAFRVAMRDQYWHMPGPCYTWSEAALALCNYLGEKM